MREKAVEGYRGFRAKITVSFIYFLATPHSSQKFSPLTRDPTQVPHSGSTESYPLDCQRSPKDHLLNIMNCSLLVVSNIIHIAFPRF